MKISISILVRKKKKIHNNGLIDTEQKRKHLEECSGKYKEIPFIHSSKMRDKIRMSIRDLRVIRMKLKDGVGI
jgi:hypothetical protein